MTDGTDAAAEVATQQAGQDGAHAEGAPAGKSACAHPEAIGRRWSDPITAERQAALQEYLDLWAAETDHGARTGPFDGGPGEKGVPLTGADASWLADWSGRDTHLRVPNLHLETLRHMESFE
jgi:hypothetical protein